MMIVFYEVEVGYEWMIYIDSFIQEHINDKNIALDLNRIWEIEPIADYNYFKCQHVERIFKEKV